MHKILITSLGLAMLFAITGCKHSNSGDSMGSMSMSSPSTMPATMPADTMK